MNCCPETNRVAPKGGQKLSEWDMAVFFAMYDNINSMILAMETCRLSFLTNLISDE